MTDPLSDATKEQPMTEQAFYRESTRKERIVGRLFPSRHVEAVFPAWATGKGDVLFTDTTVHLSLLDRVRLLLTGRLAVRTRTTCEHLVGRTASVSESYVEPPTWLTR